MIKEIYFDEVFDTQHAFRSIMQALARPGQLQKLDNIRLDPPGEFNAASACIGLTLMSQDTTFYADEEQLPQVKEYFMLNTSAQFRAIKEAEFIYMQGQGTEEVILSAHTGSSEYPETGASVIIDVSVLGESPCENALVLSMTGPGVLHEKTVFVKGISPSLLSIIQKKNREYPLGIDIFLTDKNKQVLSIPRTNQFIWKQS